MPRALILVANGTEEIEFVTSYDGQYLFSLQWQVWSIDADLYTVRTRAGFEVKSLGVNLREPYVQSAPTRITLAITDLHLPLHVTQSFHQA
jgi:hypothetical protein